MRDALSQGGSGVLGRNGSFSTQLDTSAEEAMLVFGDAGSEIVSRDSAQAGEAFISEGEVRRVIGRFGI